MVNIVHIDFETRSRALLQPAKVAVGSYKYAMHPTTQILCACYAFDSGPVIKWAPWGYSTAFDDNCRRYFLRKSIPRKERFHCPPDLREAVLSGALIAAHNSMFERAIWELILTPRYGWPLPRPEQWLCTMAVARYNGLPGALGKAAEALGLDILKGDNSAMKKMAKPRAAWLKSKKGSPWFADAALYTENVDYCAQDVETERSLYDHCIPLPPRERDIWLMDQQINWRGIPIDVDLAEAAQRGADKIFERACVELAELTNGEVTRPTQKERLKAWLQRSINIDDMQGPTIAYHLKRGAQDEYYLTPKVRRALEISQLAGGNALTKYSAFLRYNVEGRLYDAHRYYGGHTGRASSQHVQTQNLIKPPLKSEKAEPFIEPLKKGEELGYELKPVLDSLVRSVICAEDGHTLFAIDYAAIEARGVNWLAGQWDAVERYTRYDDMVKRGEPVHDVDNYIVMASKIYGIPTIMVDDHERKFGKITELGCGYGMGAPRTQEQCEDWGETVTEAFAKNMVDSYRGSHPRIVDLWYDLDNAAKRCIKTGKTQKAGRNMRFRLIRIGNVAAISFDLPSGRSLYYPQPRLVPGKYGERIQYWGRKVTGALGFVDIWGGGLTENAVQAICRDLLMGAMMEARKHVDIVMHVHDEMVAHVREDDAERLYQVVCDLMTKQLPRWAKGFPVGVDGWIGRRYRK